MSSNDGRPRRRATRSVLALTVAVALAGAWWIWLRSRHDGLLSRAPRVELAGVDPEVRSAVQKACAVVTEEPYSSGAWGELGMTLLAHDFFTAAGTSFDQAGRRDPGEPRWPYLGGLALLNGTPDSDAALDCLERACNLTGEEPTPRLRLAELLFELGRIDAAAAQLEHVIKSRPKNARALLGLGRVAHARGDLDAALAYLNRSAIGAPRVKATRALLAGIHHRKGDLARSAEERRRMEGLPDEAFWPDPHHDKVRERRVGALPRVEAASELFFRGRRADALQALERVVRDHPDYLLGRLALGRFCLQSGDAARAQVVLQKAVQLQPDAFEAHHELASACARGGDLAAAEKHYRRTVEIKPDYAPAHYGLSRIFASQNDRDASEKALRAAVRYRPNHAAAQRELGLALAAAGHVEEASEHLRLALRLNPTDAKARGALQQLNGESTPSTTVQRR